MPRNSITEMNNTAPEINDQPVRINPMYSNNNHYDTMD